MDEYVRSEAYERVLEITSGPRTGTAFTITYNGAPYLVTAAHILPEGDPNPEVLVTSRFIAEGVGAQLQLRLPLLPVPLSADIAVAPLEDHITPTHDLRTTTDGMVVSQTVYFLGFPYGLALELNEARDRVAFVKRAIVSGMARPEGVRTLYLDGINNPGFSGGPVVGFTDGAERMTVFGVVSGYLPERQPLYRVKEELQGFGVDANTGIIVATMFNEVTAAIDAATHV